MRGPILRPCIKCGRPSPNSRCRRHTEEKELERQARQPYRAAYFSPEYRVARAARIRAAGGRCEAIDELGARCPLPAQETDHIMPLSTARSLGEAIALCVVTNLRAVCVEHNPRGRMERRTT
jgi:hypothetical protein